jgi:SpoVK/Ycf46/Vps4 family AAA+-type ATPase
MPKKKKKSRSTAAENSTPKSPVENKDSSAAIADVVVVDDHVSDVLPLTLVPGSPSSLIITNQGTKTSSLKYTPTIVLHEQDAFRLHVHTSDQVFVLSYQDTPPTLKVTRSALACVRICKDETAAGTPIRSPKFSTPGSSSQSSKSKKTAFRPGSCYLYPSMLSESFLNPSFSDKDNDKTQSPQPEAISTPVVKTTTPSKATPQSSKSKFSFAIGGGGWNDAMGTPTNKSPSSTLKKIMSCQLLLIPVDSKLGDVVAAALCRTARAVHLSIDDDKNNITTKPTKFPASSGPLLQRLVLAHTVGEYISKQDIVPISWTGQSVPMRVVQVVAVDSAFPPDNPPVRKSSENDSAVDVVSSTMKQLSIDDRDHDEDHWIARVTKALRSLHPSDRAALTLYRITHDTQIRLGDRTSNNGDQDQHEDGTRPAVTNTTKPLVVGMDHVMHQVRTALETTLLHPGLFHGASSNNSTLRPPKGVLLHGPSGVGKSHLAQQLGRRLELESFHVELVHCTALQSQTAFVGQAERQLVRTFETAQRPRPHKKGCLLILDDVHLICPRRQGTNVGADRLSSTLLALLDGVDSSQQNAKSNDDTPYPLAVLAVTTNPGLLDAALRRPGRLDTEIEVSAPDEPSRRAKILQFQLENMGATLSTEFTDDNWLSLARLAKGFTGADLTLAAKEAIRKSCSENSDSYSQNLVTFDIVKLAIRSIRPSAIKAVTVEVPRVPWSSIGGMDDVKTQLQEAIELPLTHAATFKKLGIRPPRGVLLYGPPGCSKTLMARALATEGQMNFLAVKGPELLSKWLGESERALASLFRRARLASPAVIFFDEVDAIASKRGGGGSGGGERLLSQLLTELDGIQQGNVSEEGERVVIVCATNRPDLLDSALMRPGRIDRMIYVGVPDESSRERILRIGLEGKSCTDDIDFAQLVAQDVSGGLSGAELIAACRDAALKAMEEYEDILESGNDDEPNKMPAIGMSHLVGTLKEMERQITPEMLDFYATFQGRSPVQ